MRTKLNKMSWTNRLILISILLVGLTNPWSAGYITNGIEIIGRYFEGYSKHAFVVGMILLALTNVYMMYAGREKTNIPPKSAKTAKVKYLED